MEEEERCIYAREREKRERERRSERGRIILVEEGSKSRL